MQFLPTRETLLFLLFLSFNQVFLQSNDICTRTFGQSGTTFKIICPEECIKWPFKNQDVVYGTSVYHPDSPICLSALHAGVARIGAATPVTFNKAATNETFVGTVSNRVISETRDGNVEFHFGNERFVQTDRAGTDEMVTVYNNYYRSSHHLFACLPNSQETLRSSSAKPQITEWDFSKADHNKIFVDSESTSIHGLRISKTKPIRVLRCLGPNIEMDILTVIRINDDGVHAIFPTVTASLEESVTLKYSGPSYKPLRLPEAPISGTVRGKNIEITSVSLSDQGLYKGHENDSESFTRLIVRGCKKDRYGANCSGWCRDCLNNGECDSDTGECVCSSGTRGKNCQTFCPANKFGAECQLDCKGIRSFWQKKGKCNRLVFCLRDPKGCSCFPGYQPPGCLIDCNAGTYGPDCLSTCNYCSGDTCDSYNGRCDYGCKNATLCNEDNAPLNLPRFRKPPLITDCDVRGCAVTFSDWDSDYDDGELSNTDGELRYEISIENADNSSEIADIPTNPGQRREFSYNFFRGNSYNIKLNVLTNRGKATEEYNMRIQSHHLTLPCLDKYSSVDYNVTHIRQTDISVEWPGWVNQNGPLCPIVRYTLLVMDGARTILNTSSDSSTYAINHLTPDTLYQITLDGKTRSITTLPNPPASPDNIRINVTSDKTRIAWNDVEYSSSYEVTIKPVEYPGCPHNSNPNGTEFKFTETEMILDYNNQISYSTMYNVCIVGVNLAGKSASSACQTFSTPPKEVPDIEWRELDCSTRSQYQTLDCTIGIASECQKFHGPNITSVWKIKKLPKCPNGTSYANIIEDIFTYSTSLTKTFLNLEHYNEYSIEVYLKNSIGQSISTQGVFSTMESNSPAVVQDFKVSKATNNSLSLEWLVPCPSLAPIQTYKLSYRKKNKWQRKNVNSSSLCESSKGSICYQLEDLNFNVNYSLKVQSCKRKKANNCSEDSEIIMGLTTPIAPGKPKLKPMNALHGIDVVVTTSQYVGQQPSCWTSLHKGNLLQKNSSKHSVDPLEEYTFSFTGLRPSSKYLVKSGCCNSKACSAVAETVTNTKLAEPVLARRFLSGNTTNTTIVIRIPVIESGDSMINVVIIVYSGYSEQKMNFSDLYDKYNRNGMEKKHSTEKQLGTKLYVAGVVENAREFTVGSGDTPSNPPLVRGEVYSVIPLIELKLNNDRLLVEEPKIIFTAGGLHDQPTQYLWMVLMAVILVVIALPILLIGIFTYRSKKAVKVKPEEDLWTRRNESKSGLDEIASHNENENLQPSFELQALPTSSKDNSQIDTQQELHRTAAVTEQPIHENDIRSEREYGILPQSRHSIQSEAGHSRPLFSTFGV